MTVKAPNVTILLRYVVKKVLMNIDAMEMSAAAIRLVYLTFANLDYVVINTVSRVVSNVLISFVKIIANVQVNIARTIYAQTFLLIVRIQL